MQCAIKSISTVLNATGIAGRTHSGAIALPNSQTGNLEKRTGEF